MKISAVLLRFLNLLTMGVLGDNIFWPKENIIQAILRNVQIGSKLLDNVLTDDDFKTFAKGKELEDVHLTIEELIRKYGYPFKKYEVTTSDGYILTVFRIPSPGQPILLMHGLLMSADDWVTPGLKSGIAYLLAAKGYDVWLGNVRGNKHSRRHIHLSPESPEFWNFSFDEMGRYDLPAMIDFILNATQKSRLIYLGHSQGTTMYYVMGSERPEYNKKVSLMIGLAPAAAVPNVKSPILLFIKYVSFMHPDLLFAILRKIGLNEFLPEDGIIQAFSTKLCGKNELNSIICSNLAFLFCGFSYSQLNITQLPVVLAHSPSGVSTKQIQHYAQTITFRKFIKFDYGAEKNKHLYGRRTPPEYNIGAIKTPMAMFYSSNDWLATETDTLHLYSKLNNVIDFHKLPGTFNHLDFLYGIDVSKVVFPRLLRLIKESV